MHIKFRKVENNYIKVHDTYGNGVYSWEGKEIKVYNSYFTQLNGPAVQMSNEGTTTQPLIVIDKNTVVDNYMTGTESWFSLWGLSELAIQLKSALQPVMNGMGASISSSKTGSESNNLIFIFEPIRSLGENTSGILEDGTKVDNKARECYCTLYYGGEKAVINGETLSTGVKSVRNYDYLTTSGDRRIQGGLHAFGVTPFADTQSFNIAAATTAEFLSDATKRAATISYALGMETWDNIKQITIAQVGGYSLDQLGITQNQFDVVSQTAFEYMVVRDVVLGVIAGASAMVDEQHPLDAIMATQYDTVIAQIAKAIGFEDNENIIALLKTKVTAEHINNLVKIYMSNNAQLISRGTINNDTNFVQFMLLKFANCENVGAQAFEIAMPLGTGSTQIVLVEYGFLDQEYWA